MSTPNNANNSEQTPHATLRQMIYGFRIAQLIYVAAKLGIADLLREQPQAIDQLAKATSAQPRFLYRVLRALASVGIFKENEQSQFELTPLAEPLCQDHGEASLRSWAMLFGSEDFWRPWGELLHTVMTGETAFEHVFGMDRFEYLNQHPEAGERFNQGMTNFSALQMDATSVLEAYDFSGASTLIDVGGGQGSFIAEVLKAYPAIFEAVLA